MQPVTVRRIISASAALPLHSLTPRSLTALLRQRIASSKQLIANSSELRAARYRLFATRYPLKGQGDWLRTVPVPISPSFLFTLNRKECVSW